MQCASGRTYRGSELFLHYYVYTYSDPKNGQIRYVGKGNYFRAWSHLNESSNRELHALIKKRQTEGFNVQPLILQLFATSGEKDAYELECKLISYHGRKDLGLGPLFNYTDGGSKDPGKITANALEFRGVHYANLSICAREYGVAISNVYRRIRLNWTLALMVATAAVPSTTVNIPGRVITGALFPAAEADAAGVDAGGVDAAGVGALAPANTEVTLFFVASKGNSSTASGKPSPSSSVSV